MVQQSLLDSVIWHVRTWDDIKRTSWFTLSNYLNIFLFIVFVVYAILQTRAKIVRNPVYSMCSATISPFRQFAAKHTHLR